MHSTLRERRVRLDFVGLGIGLLLVLGIVVYTSTQPDRVAPPRPTPAPPSVGQTVQGVEWRVRVTKVTELAELPEGSRLVKPQGKYVLVYLTVWNDGKRQNSLGFSSFTLYDSALREYDVARAAPGLSGFNPTYRASDNASLPHFTTDLLPSLSLDTALAFDVVPTAGGFELGGPTLGKTRIQLSP